MNYLPASECSGYHVIAPITSSIRFTTCMTSLREKIKRVVIAAIAFGKHLVSFRTQQLSRNT